MPTFLSPFVTDMQQLLYNHGVEWQDSSGITHTTKCTALVSSVASVARAMLQDVKQFNGKNGCGVCLHTGEIVTKYKGVTRVYPLISPAPLLRTKQQMLQHATDSTDCVYGVKGASPLLLQPRFHLAKGFSPEYMHCCFWGVVRQL